MKKIINYVIILIFSFVFVGNVSAAGFKVGDAFTVSYTGQLPVSGLSYNTGSETIAYDNGGYSSTSNGTTYTTYCMDPHKTGGTTYKIDRILGDSKNSDEVRAFDYGILKILEKGYNQFNSSLNGVSGNDFYNATSIAIRAFMLGLYDWGGAASQYTYKSSAHTNLGIEWAAEFSDNATIASGACSGSSDMVQCFRNRAKSAYSWYSPNATFNYSSGSVGGNVITTAKMLFEEGVNAAANFMESGTASGSIQYTVGNAVQDERNEDQVKEHIIIELKLTDFSENNSISGFKVTPTSNNAGITIDSMEYSIDGENYSELNESVNVAQDLEAVDGVINATVKIKLNITKVVDENCQSMNFTVDFNYTDENTGFQGAVLKDTTRTDTQRFLVITKFDEGKMSIPGTIKCAQEVCDTVISVPICSDVEDEAVSEITAPEDIKKCILDNEDDAGNSYKLANSGIDSGNEYCQVFCKEDYKDVIENGKLGGLKLNPVIKDVNCGGYFQLSAHVEGKKDCYTGGTAEDKSINMELFIERIVEAQETMIENYDLLLMATAASEDDYNEDGCTISGTYQTYVAGSANDDGEVPFRSTTGAYVYGDSGDGETCDPSVAIDDINSDIETAKSELEAAKEDYMNAIKDLNACTAAWTMEFPFEQRLKFKYDEYQSNDEFYSGYYDLLSDENYYLESKGDLTEESEVEICLSDTNDKYECEGDSRTYESVSVSADDMNVASEYGDVYEDFTFTLCDENGCDGDDQKVSQAKFIRKTIKKSQEYETPTVFYQIATNGKITVNSGYAGNAVQLEALENSLPVSTSAVGGGRFELLLEDLGEFYNPQDAVDSSHPYGRLIDFEGDDINSSSENSVAKKLGEEGIETFDGRYPCHYESPCRPDDCPNCDFVCEGDDCDFEECPDCIFECVNCIFNLDELQLNFKPISPSDVNSADRDYGYNWDINTTLEQLTLISDKAEQTIKEIEEVNETIYDKTGDDSQLAFSIKLTPNIINDLKEYNEENERYGGYANDSLTCYDATINGKTYKNIYCYSEVIDELYSKYESKITVKNRTNSSNRTSSNANANGYWTLWPEWTESAKNENGQYIVIGGPSWK